MSQFCDHLIPPPLKSESVQKSATPYCSTGQCMYGSCIQTVHSVYRTVLYIACLRSYYFMSCLQCIPNYPWASCCGPLLFDALPLPVSQCLYNQAHPLAEHNGSVMVASSHRSTIYLLVVSEARQRLHQTPTLLAHAVCCKTRVWAAGLF